MPRFVVELDLDGYESEEAMEKACLEFIRENLDTTASSVKVWAVDPTRIMIFSAKASDGGTLGSALPSDSSEGA